VDLDTGSLVAGMTGLSFRLEVNSDSIEVRPEDNSLDLNIRLFSQVLFESFLTGRVEMSSSIFMPYNFFNLVFM
jgi:hypothetical protein